MAVLKSFINGIRLKVGEVEFGLDIEPETGAADSGDLEVDLPSLIAAVSEGAQERKAGERFEAGALDGLFEITQGYPYFLQECTAVRGKF